MEQSRLERRQRVCLPVGVGLLPVDTLRVSSFQRQDHNSVVVKVACACLSLVVGISRPDCGVSARYAARYAQNAVHLRGAGHSGKGIESGSSRYVDIALLCPRNASRLQ